MTDPTNVFRIRRALVSVSDKAGLEVLGRALREHGVEIIASGGTRRFLEERGIPCTPIESVTGNPESFDGRMKTLSFQISSALLFRRDSDDDVRQAAELQITPIDLVVCNLYPFEQTARRGAEWPELVEEIDVGGPTMIRAAAKNHRFVAVCTSPSQYPLIIAQIAVSGGLDNALRTRLALDAFRHTARYDSAIASRFEQRLGLEPMTPVIDAGSAIELRYGENPHQRAWSIGDPFDSSGIAQAVPIQGKALSYNNLLDADAAWRCNGDLATIRPNEHVVTIIKHLGPCGAAAADDGLAALQAAWAGDPVSSFGGIVCFNRLVDDSIATWLDERFVEVIIAPEFSTEALATFARKKNLRLLAVGPHDGAHLPPIIRSISGGWVMQQEDVGIDSEFRTVTRKSFPNELIEVGRFGIMATKHLKSNAIGLFQMTDGAISMIGAGMGNPNRLISMKQAIEKTSENGHTDLSHTVLVSDAFFPFPDNVERARSAGICHIIQPGGSIKDEQVIAACDEAGIAMLFTGRRHFRH